MVHFSIFDEEVEEVGQEVDAYCVRCKADTLHVVLRQDDDEIRRVRCNVCDEPHAFRKPRGEEEEPAEAPSKKKHSKAKPTWSQVFGSAKKEIKAYHVNDVFSEMDLLDHSQFGKGFVSQLMDYNKIEVTFQDSKRVLIHNRMGKPLPTLQFHAVVQENMTTPSKLYHADDLASDLDALLEMVPGMGHPLDDSDGLLGKSTKLSPKAWAELHADEEPMESDEEDVDADLDEEEAAPRKKQKGKAKLAGKKTTVAKSTKAVGAPKGRTEPVSVKTPKKTTSKAASKKSK